MRCDCYALSRFPHIPLAASSCATSGFSAWWSVQEQTRAVSGWTAAAAGCSQTQGHVHVKPCRSPIDHDQGLHVQLELAFHLPLSIVSHPVDADIARNRPRRHATLRAYPAGSTALSEHLRHVQDAQGAAAVTVVPQCRPAQSQRTVQKKA